MFLKHRTFQKVAHTLQLCYNSLEKLKLLRLKKGEGVQNTAYMILDYRECELLLHYVINAEYRRLFVHEDDLHTHGEVAVLNLIKEFERYSRFSFSAIDPLDFEDRLVYECQGSLLWKKIHASRYFVYDVANNCELRDVEFVHQFSDEELKEIGKHLWIAESIVGTISRECGVELRLTWKE